MRTFFKPVIAVGVEKTHCALKTAEVSKSGKTVFIQSIKEISLPEENNHVKRLDIGTAPLATTLNGCDILVRSLQIPLRKPKEIDAALPFQTEPMLPYPSDQSILARQILNQTADGSELTVFSIRKDLLKKHLAEWQQIQIEPEVVTCIQTALAAFGKHFVSTKNPYLILHIQEQWMTCLLVKAGKVLASYTHPEGLDLIRQSAEANGLPLKQMDFKALPNSLQSAFKKLQQAFVKKVYALSKEMKGSPLEGLLLTGESVQWQHFAQALTENLNFPLLNEEDAEKRRYAAAIGMAIEALPDSDALNFRQQEFAYPYPWKRLKWPLLIYFVLMGLLTMVFYLFGQNYLRYEEDQIKEKYVELLAAMNKPYETFEKTFQAKNPAAQEKANGEIINAIHLDRQDLNERLAFLQKDLQATPQSFPLFANIPRVSDVLAWLSNHPNVVGKGEDGKPESRLQLENFNYIMLKRPIQGKKQENYQVKIELEFSSPMPKWAREFHDALIAPNDFVDPKGEVKWNSNRGRYRTSFFLKDKTTYPGQS